MKVWINDDYISTNDRSKTTKVLVDRPAVKPVDIIVGGGLMLLGTAWLMFRSYVNGAIGYKNAEYNALDELGLISDSDSDEEEVDDGTENS